MRLLRLALASALTLAAQNVEENRTINKRFAVSSAPEIVVSVITGHIHVTPAAGNEVVMNAKVHYEAPDGGSLGDLLKNIRLESEQQGNSIWIGTEGENWNGSIGRSREFGWRAREAAARTASRNNNDRERRRWSFRHDIELQVPRNAHLKLSTVNGGDIQVTGIAGEFAYNNVNGGIDVKDADGFGRLHTVNGPVSVSFTRNPGGAVSIKTVNGKISLVTPAGLNADFRIKTLNGKLFSDFPLTASASSEVKTSTDGMKRIWRSGGASSLRAGSGGNEISIDGLNGDIQIQQRKN